MKQILTADQVLDNSSALLFTQDLFLFQHVHVIINITPNQFRIPKDTLQVRPKQDSRTASLCHLPQPPPKVLLPMHLHNLCAIRTEGLFQ